MSRILKAPYINIDNYIIIDNTFTSSKKNETQQNNEVDKYSKELQVEIDGLRATIIAEANKQANDIIEQAKLKAEADLQNLKLQMQQEMDIKAEELYKEAFDKGYNEGYEKAELDCEQMRKEAQQIVEQAEEEKVATINNLEPEIIKFIIDTTQNILTDSFQFNPSVISLLIKKGLCSIKEVKNLKIFLSEKNYNFVEKNKFKILEVDTDKNNIEIIKDISLKDTDCIIETDIGTINCNIDEQMSSIKEALHHILN